MNLFRTTAFLSALAIAGVACDRDETNDLGDDDLAYLIDADTDEVVDALVLTTAQEMQLAMDDFEDEPEAEHTFSGDCFTLVYPVEIAYPDGSVTAAADGEELRGQIRSYLMASPANLRRRARPTLVYPVAIQLADGTLDEVDTRLEFAARLRECRGAFEPCATLVYPVEVNVGGAVEPFATGDDLRAALASYRRANPGAPLSSFVFPLDFVTRAGDTVAVADRRGYRALVGECHDVCFRFVYPVTVEHPRAGTRTVGSRPILRRALSHAGPRGRWFLTYPLTVEVDGTAVVVEDREAMRELRASCRR